ncbi:Uncharacterised protein [Yersinia intermedia]|jgi:hypothetical protein|nr:Uncharacterised protein [Yersinia intermedia]VDZ50848.1 Uncharacterised protein [Yersinia intermedia]
MIAVYIGGVTACRAWGIYGVNPQGANRGRNKKGALRVEYAFLNNKLTD